MAPGFVDRSAARQGSPAEHGSAPRRATPNGQRPDKPARRPAELSPAQQALLDLQQTAGNHAVAATLTQGDGRPPPTGPVSVQRQSEETPKQRVTKAVDEGSPDLIAALDNEALAAATPDQRLRMIRVLNEQGSAFQRIKLPRLWDAFGAQLRGTADANAGDWKRSFEVAAPVMRGSYNVMSLRAMFYRDVVHVANDFLDQNEQYCKGEFARLGLTETGEVPAGPPTDEQAQALAGTREDATRLAADQEALADLRNVIVGYASVEFPPGGTGPPVYVGDQMGFDPERPPGHGPLETDTGMKTWAEVKTRYDALDLLIRARLMANPTLFPLARGAHEDPTNAKTVSTGTDTEALKTVGDGLKGVLENIARTRPLLTTLAPDLEPIQGQLIAGTRTAAPDRNWQASPCYAAIAADTLEERKPGPWWQTLGLAVAEMGAYLVAGLATGGTAIAIGLAGKGVASTALAAGRAQALTAAYGATTTEEMSLIAEGQVDRAKAEVIETAAFALLDTVVAAGAARGALREIRQFERVAAANAARAGERADRLVATQVVTDAKQAAAEAKSELPAVTADAEASARAAQDAESAARSATPEEAARAHASMQAAQESAARAKTAAAEVTAVAEGRTVARATPILDPSGMGSKAAYDAAVRAARKEIGSGWTTMTAAQRETTAVKVVADRMDAQGIPRFAGVVHRAGKGLGAADFTTWTLQINPTVFSGSSSMESIVGLIYHEAAHFEDFVNVARLKLGEGLSPAQIEALTRINGKGVQAAVAKGPLTSADAGFGRARSIFESMWGTNSAARQTIYRNLSLAKLDYSLEEVRLYKIIDKKTKQLLPGRTKAELQTQVGYLEAKSAFWKDSVKRYEALPEEARAFGVQEGLTQSFEREAFRRRLLVVIEVLAAAGASVAGLRALAESGK